jgi:putative hydrolase of the HAD superfamily
MSYQSDHIKHVLFDLDNTLWDFSGNSKKILAEIFTAFELNKIRQIDFTTFHKQYIFRNEFLWKEYALGNATKEEVRFNRFFVTLSDFGISDYKLASDIADYYIHHTRTQKDLLPHAIEILEYLQGKYDLHIITNGFEEVQLFKIRNSGIDRYFKTITTAEAANALKPDKRIFDFALRSIQAPASACLYIGDSAEVDGTGAINAGMEFIWLRNQKTNSDYPFQQVSTLAELTELL